MIETKITLFWRAMFTLPLLLGLGACQTLPDNFVTPVKPAMRFNADVYHPLVVQVGDKKLKVRAYTGIHYLSQSSDPEYQQLNIYIPDTYFLGGKINGYDAASAPIFFPNNASDHMPVKPMLLTDMTHQDDNQMLAKALMRGYVVASAGMRGYDTSAQSHQQVFAASTDLRSALHYLMRNDVLMPGDAKKIIASGVAAGGTLALLLGLGDDALLMSKETEMAAHDKVFAVAIHNPHTDAEHESMAYVWQFFGGDACHKGTVAAEYAWCAKTAELSALLTAFTDYVNGLGLVNAQGMPLRLNELGEGSFKDEIIHHLEQAANEAWQRGVDLSAYVFFDQRKSSKPYYLADFMGFLTNYVQHGQSMESHGDNSTWCASFEGITDATCFLDVQAIDPVRYLQIADTNKMAQHWYIRQGAADGRVSFATATIWATMLEMKGRHVDFAIPWDKKYTQTDVDALLGWIDEVAR